MLDQHLAFMVKHDNFTVSSNTSGLFIEHFQKTQGQKNSASKQTQGRFWPKNSRHRDFLRLCQINFMRQNFWRLYFSFVSNNLSKKIRNSKKTQRYIKKSRVLKRSLKDFAKKLKDLPQKNSRIC